MNIKDIADERDMSTITIEGHLTELFEEKKITPQEIFTLVSSAHIQKIQSILLSNFPSGVDKLKPIKDALDELPGDRISYFEIKIGIVMTKLYPNQ